MPQGPKGEKRRTERERARAVMIARISAGESFSFAAVSDAGVLGLAEARGAAPMPYKIEYMNGGELVKTVDLPELAQDGMVEHGANFARILNDDGVEV
jgi:hypothetical protein